MTPNAQAPSGGRLLDANTAEGLALELARAFQVAASRSPVHERRYLLSGRSTRLRIVGEELARRVQLPFSHLEVFAEAEVDACELTIDLWDPSASGVSMPPASLDAVDLAMQPPIAVSADGRFVGHRLLHTLTWLDRRHHNITGAIDPSAGLMLFEIGRPLYFPLMLWLRDQRVQFLHAGMVARQGNGVILCGPSGSGKSTTSLLCLLSGFDFLGDDYIGVQQDAEGFSGHSLFGSTYVDAENLRRFPILDAHAIHGTGPGEDKSVVLLPEVMPERLAASARIRAVLLPEVTGQEQTSIEAASRGYALRRAAPSSILQLLAPDGAALQRISALIEGVPCYRVGLGRDREKIPARIQELLTTLV